MITLKCNVYYSNQWINTRCHIHGQLHGGGCIWTEQCAADVQTPSCHAFINDLRIQVGL